MPMNFVEVLRLWPMLRQRQLQRRSWPMWRQRQPERSLTSSRMRWTKKARTATRISEARPKSDRVNVMLVVSMTIQTAASMRKGGNVRGRPANPKGEVTVVLIPAILAVDAGTTPGNVRTIGSVAAMGVEGAATTIAWDVIPTLVGGKQTTAAFAIAVALAARGNVQNFKMSRMSSTLRTSLKTWTLISLLTSLRMLPMVKILKILMTKTRATLLKTMPLAKPFSVIFAEE
mmetsp:Transcript_30323/g.54913  ORF Transcript_30323/g.54913 Transcript_30323/m.54913 type:complete len:231 (+) Transcript_30323:179-871(+)